MGQDDTSVLIRVMSLCNLGMPRVSLKILRNKIQAKSKNPIFTIMYLHVQRAFEESRKTNLFLDLDSLGKGYDLQQQEMHDLFFEQFDRPPGISSFSINKKR